jgi:hypothetical protein
MNYGNTVTLAITRGILRVAGGTALGMVLTFALPITAHAQTVTPPVVPAGLDVEAGNEPFLVGHAVGTQNYVCQPTGPFGRVGWVLFTPEATLFGERSDQLITHFFSPNPDEDGRVVRATWESSLDTSMVWAKAIASAMVDSTAIPWVLLQAVGTQEGPTGGTTLSITTFVQRVHTEGGLPPATDCQQLTDVGRKAFSPYTADYFFYRGM